MLRGKSLTSSLRISLDLHSGSQPLLVWRSLKKFCQTRVLTWPKREEISRGQVSLISYLSPPLSRPSPSTPTIFETVHHKINRYSIMAAPWFSIYGIPALPPYQETPLLYNFQDKALEQVVYSLSQVQWLGVNNASGSEKKDNEVLRWLGASVLKGLTGMLMMSLFPDLGAGGLEVRNNSCAFRLCF